MAREFWETVAELAGALAAPQIKALGLRVTDLSVDLPVEMVVVQTAVGFRLLVDAPHYRWDAGIRPEPGRLRLALAEPSENRAATRTGD